VRVEGLGPIRIRLRRHRWFLWERFGEHDGPIFAAFERLIEPGDVVWDIGANIGVYTRVLRQWFQAGPIVAIEPMEENFTLLTANIKLGGLSDVRCLRLALSDHEGSESLQIDDVTSGSAVLDSVSGGAPSAGRRSAGLPPRTEVVRVARLDDLVSHGELPAPKIMKIDTEGAEVKVLEGAEALLRRTSVLMAIALHGPDKAAGTILTLARFGYVACGLVRHGAGAAWRELRLADVPSLANNNIIAGPAATAARLVEPLRCDGPWPRPRNAVTPSPAGR
jgi:FkbM family methyltransferase